MGLSNPLVVEHMNALFGSELAEKLRHRLEGYDDSRDRELDILETLCEALNPDGKRLVLPFTFKNERGSRTSHHLIFVTKHPLGYGIMKGVMARESTSAPQGVPSFEYSVADARYPVLFEYSRPLDELQGTLLEEFRGQTVTVGELFEAHNVGRPFILKNYQEAVIALEARGLVITDRSERNRLRNECPKRIRVTFGG